MGLDSYQWGELTPGMTLQPKGWVLTRDLTARTAGAQWLAMDPTSGTEVLLYFPPLSVVEDDVLFDEWQRRSSRLVSKSVPLFQQVVEVVIKGVKWPFAVIEAVDGLDLNHFRLSLENRTIPISQLKGWLESVSVALDRAHEDKQFHGRLTPESLVLNRGGEIRILHHGWLALFSDLEQRAEGKLKSLLPMVYSSPQVLDGRAARATDDVYSFSATLYELITSQPPFVSGDLAHQVRNVEPDSLRQRLEDLGENPNRVPHNLDSAISKCLLKDPSKRFQKVGAFWEAAWAEHSVGNSEESQSRSPVIPAIPVSQSETRTPMDDVVVLSSSVEPVIQEVGPRKKEEMSAPYYPPPPMTSDKRFGVVFVVIVVTVIVVIGYFMDQYRDSLVDKDSFDIEGELLSNTIPSISTNLSTYDEFAALLEVPENVGWLSVRSEPAEAIAELWLNSREIPIEQVTPTVFSNLPPGEVELRIVASGFSETNLITSIVAGETNRVSARLQIDTGDVSLTSNPDGVGYVLSRGGKEIRSGQCPDEFRVKVGLYQLEYVVGERRKTTYLRVGSKQLNEASIEFEAGSLTVESNPEEAEVYLGGLLVGMTPMIATNLPPGEHRVIIKTARHRSVVVMATVNRDIETFVSKELESLPFPEPQEEWENSLGMGFVPVGSDQVLFGVHEVTRKDFIAFVKNKGGAFSVSNSWEPLSEDVSSGDVEALPVVNISCEEADAFCRWLTEWERSQGLLQPQQQYRIPTDTEWDLAVLLSTGSTIAFDSFPWGNRPGTRSVGNYGAVRFMVGEREVVLSDPFPSLAPVGQFASNRFGLFDLGGNVREWCLFSGPSNSDQRMARGGSWKDEDRSRILSEFRESLSADARHDDLGFRVVLSLGEGIQ
ncbi:MAG: SUMF1/EgtB/PvdO family nonheme iron enzyme [Verrucomicrobia bacterium]|jgi:serine/threonine protein kinase|nr:SUMF1/EgtB/PvdO family nonheme iron enzyme [Verrucomicrobiota bacterium]MDA7645348.1 SUMF1/EgtB/PvdO family nonheme iron enzyme [bacterium]